MSSPERDLDHDPDHELGVGDVSVVCTVPTLWWDVQEMNENAYLGSYSISGEKQWKAFLASDAVQETARSVFRRRLWTKQHGHLFLNKRDRGGVRTRTGFVSPACSCSTARKTQRIYDTT